MFEKYKHCFKNHKLHLDPLTNLVKTSKTNSKYFCSFFLNEIKLYKKFFFERNNFFSNNKHFLDAAILIIQNNIKNKLSILNNIIEKESNSFINQIICMRIKNLKKLLYSIKYGCLDNLFLVLNNNNKEIFFLYC